MKGNRTIEVNHKLNELKTRAEGLLTSEEGLKHRSKNTIEVEAVFEQLKSNNKFNRFTFKGIEKVEMEFLLMALVHNFRKMVAKGVTSKEIVIKPSKQGSKNDFYTSDIRFCGSRFFLNQISSQKFSLSKISRIKKLHFLESFFFHSDS